MKEQRSSLQKPKTRRMHLPAEEHAYFVSAARQQPELLRCQRCLDSNMKTLHFRDPHREEQRQLNGREGAKMM